MRAVRRLVGVLVVLALVALGVDRLGAYLATRAVTAHLRTDAHATGPHALLTGFPFLTQVAAGRYDDVRLRAASLPAGPLLLTGFHAELRGVHLGAGPAIRGTVMRVPIDHVSGGAAVSYADLQTALRAQSPLLRGITVNGGADGIELASPAVPVLGLRIRIPVEIAVDDGRLHLTVRDTPTQQIARALDAFGVEVPALPYGLRLTQAHPTAAGVTFAVTGAATTFPS